MNSLEIQYFLTIVKYGSFTEAAQALSVSQPAISKQIRQLEAELGCSLFQGYLYSPAVPADKLIEYVRCLLYTSDAADD